MTLGDIINDYRSKHQLTMDDFAKIANISKAYISMLEKNRNSSNGKPIVPSLPTLKKVAVATNVTIDELLNLLDRDQPIIIPEEKKQHITPTNKNNNLTVQDKLSSILDELTSESSVYYHEGKLMTQEDKQLLRITLENTMRMAEEMLKQKK